ncbi:MAG: hypothetical protein HKN68_07540 [Saprospiraceae bacterium]|nr:hypothetical protein [Saprospiraceae bacterium]
MRQLVFINVIICFSLFQISAQNVGIDINSPTEKLQVNGVMHTTQGGVRFPDGTLQTTAAMNTTHTGDLPEYPVKMYFIYDNNNPPSSYLDWVQIYGLSYDHFRDPGNPQMPCLENLIITKTLDQFSTDLYRKNFSRLNMNDNEIHITRTINGTELPVMVISFDLMIINNISKSTNSVGNGKYKLQEEIELNTTGGITITYNDYDSQGNVIFSSVEVVCN